jgi:hypothetical protein
MMLRSERARPGFPSFSSACAAALVAAVAFGCDGGSTSSAGPSGADENHDHVADDLGQQVDADHDGVADGIDIDGDGKPDGPGLDTDGDGKADALALDADCDQFYDSIDVNRDGKPDFASRLAPPGASDDCPPSSGAAGSAGSNGASGSSTTGSSGAGSMAGSGGSAGGGTGELGKGDYQGTGTSSDRYAESDIYRDGVGYKFIANGWGSGWQNHKISWNGTSFTVASLNGNVGENYSPAGYPTVFCGLYSEPPKPSIGTCGLPGAISSLHSIKTGWRWKATGNGGQYNAAWDIWLGNGNSLSSYLMVWLRDPPGQQPAGAAATAGVTVAGLPGQWNIWTGNVNGHPIVNYVKAEGQDLPELEYDVMDVYRDAIKRNYNLPGSNILAVAVGYEVWNGPITNLVTEDFYVDVE